MWKHSMTSILFLIQQMAPSSAMIQPSITGGRAYCFDPSGWYTCLNRHLLGWVSDLSKHWLNARWNRCQEDLNSFRPWRTGGDHQDSLVLRGWRLSSKTWNPVTCPLMKQLTWLRIVHSGDWCLHLVLHTPTGACQKWINVYDSYYRRYTYHCSSWLSQLS